MIECPGYSQSKKPFESSCCSFEARSILCFACTVWCRFSQLYNYYVAVDTVNQCMCTVIVVWLNSSKISQFVDRMDRSAWVKCKTLDYSLSI